MKFNIPKTCERCAQPFGCGYSSCWCRDVVVTEAQYANIIKQYEDCLCPSCLSELTARPPETPDSTQFPQR